MDILSELMWYNIIFCDAEGNNIESTLAISQPYKIGEEISIINRMDREYTDKWIKDLDNTGSVYKVVDISHELKQSFSDKKRVTKNVWIELEKIKDWK